MAVVGCYAQTAPEEMERVEGVNLILGTKDKGKIAELVEQYRRQYFTTPEFNRLVAAWPEAAQEAKKRCSQSNS